MYAQIRKEVRNVGHWQPYNPNPQGKAVGDCAVRACTVATRKSWDDVYMELTLEGFARCDLISANHVWGRYLKKHGYTREFVRDDCDTCYTVDDFCREHPKGTFILALTGHVVAVQDGNYLDSWDSGREVPIYYWHKEDDR